MFVSLDWFKSLRDVIVTSLRDSWLPFPVDKSICNKWREGLAFDSDSGTVLYTSCLYQLAPVIERAVTELERFGVTKGGVLARFAAVGTKVFGKALLRPSDEELNRANVIVKNIYNTLRALGIKFRVLDNEPYSGALLYELGFVNDFADYAKSVYKIFRDNNVNEVITIDPHTQHTLEKLYPKYVPEFNIKIRSYLDYLDPGRVRVKLGEFAIHDSCLYARYLNKYDLIRGLFRGKADVKEDPVITGRDTSHCCGGPIESTYPEIAGKVASNRVKELARLSRNVIVQCPICYVNLRRGVKLSGVEVNLYDIAEAIEVSG
ncbi:Fe-S oxidoreductase [Vulcanisaeta moutnovskia 768-28]|uniref:Fe-S oxidoreductase n=1 Tax=Vulcanisaeta moutnovskia (strain 768-28) TaxID=985053 RepID=F0QV20_VULM7|nr:(Fe-S)-binding protein [Vulcanisaeta moutnovskia]ADY00752.1 Fe-S oxidoreductase [Vulcanisaeta moutnovskia 768-28]